MIKLAAYPTREGFQHRIAVDRGDRLKELEHKGYIFVTDAHGNKLCEKVGTNPDGSDQMGYLMEISESVYKNMSILKNNALRMCEGQMLKFISADIYPAEARNIWVARLERKLNKVKAKMEGKMAW